ncbi:hypothetical protein J2Z40_003876 [Cytobacillus eiseniae]|uniref:Cardiolipin synthase N-terminal domain-containing protein n=1 Tax=Cytobacillus eiseniae TaxID=762947 RepID=A0ABS4RK42_9BACI|nr:PLDc N-terminal domain-containing protein [Cytobacillus eiseniae]MBP2243277.1 hypothetical protein [Cytobacillus eiseniae]
MDTLFDVNWALLTPLLVLQAILMAFALVNCAKQEETNGPKWMWILIIIIVNIVGPVIYFLIGRKNNG